MRRTERRSAITVPTLVIAAEWDADLPTYQAVGCFAQLTGAPCKQWVQLGEETHTVVIERNRMRFVHEVGGLG